MVRVRKRAARGRTHERVVIFQRVRKRGQHARILEEAEVFYRRSANVDRVVRHQRDQLIEAGRVAEVTGNACSRLAQSLVLRAEQAQRALLGVGMTDRVDCGYCRVANRWMIMSENREETLECRRMADRA